MSPDECKQAIQKMTSRGIAVLRDDVGPDQRAVLVAPAQRMNAARFNELIHLSGGIICVALSSIRVESFMLTRMARPETSAGVSTDSASTLSYCVSVDAREGIHSGISAADRAATIAILGEEVPVPRKLVAPGHIFPVVAREGGVLVKNTLPEGALDIVRISGATPAAVFIDCLDPRGRLLDVSGQDQLVQQHDIPLIKLSALIRYRLETEKLVEKVAEARLPTALAGELRSCVYRSKLHDGEHVALIKGEIDPSRPTLTRVQSEYTFSDVFGGKSPATRRQLHGAMRTIGERGSGVLLYLRKSLQGVLGEQISAGPAGARTSPADVMREYGLGAQILHDIGVRKIELLTNSEKNLVGLVSFGIEIVSQRQFQEYDGLDEENPGAANG